MVCAYDPFSVKYWGYYYFRLRIWIEKEVLNSPSPISSSLPRRESLRHFRSMFLSIFLENFRNRSSCPQMFFNGSALKNFTIFPGKHLCWSLFLIRKPRTQVFYCESFEILKNTSFTEQLRWLILHETSMISGLIEREHLPGMD